MMITLSSHHPFTLPEKNQTLDGGAFKGLLFGDYLESIPTLTKHLGNSSKRRSLG
ncbi:hypothetical protein [Paenibacillus sp. CAA11]|uniref:hypothetical protein n=1 Tax=Paenibacillus sp. CAA11 TaxID=1532905 RepID=UPI00131EDF7D|nr:hypothetical protein [Paenibacillus sp. CAA11]